MQQIPVRMGRDGLVRLMYAKPHVDKEEQLSNKVLFVCNIGRNCTAADLTRVFERFGRIAGIDMQAKDQIARISFADDQAVKQVMKMKLSDWGTSVEDLPIIVNNSSLLVGLIEKEETRVKSVKELQEQVDGFMEVHDAEYAAERANEAAERNKPDEDGWVKVSRGGKRNRAEEATGGFAVGVAHAVSDPATVKRQKVLQDFYSFQKRESKRKQIANLRKRFEADKMRIAKLNAGRKFKPAA